jgi:hypothetical protein
VTEGACYGFGVSSSVPLEYLREGGGDPLEVTESARDGHTHGDQRLLLWAPTADQPLDAELWSNGTGFRLRIGAAGWFSVEPDKGRIEIPVDGGLRAEERLWGIPIVLCFRARGDLPLHAAAVEVDDGAVLLAAPRTYGKTTMAAAFHRAGHRVLSEDTSCLRLGPEPSIVPGPAMLRLRRDVAAALDLPRARPLAADLDRVHYALDEPGDCVPVPVRAVVFLDEGGTNAGLQRVEVHEAIRDLWALSFRIPTEDDVSRSFAGVTDLASAVPVFRFTRSLDLDRLDDHVASVLAGV